jgi:hypothetical protein
VKFLKYANAEAFGADALELLLENEVQNNLLVSFILRENANKADWLFATVKDAAGSVALSAAWTGLPHNIVLYETDNKPSGAALKVLADELKALGLPFPGVLAERELAERFAEVWGSGYDVHLTMNCMRLDKVNDVMQPPGFARPLREDDMFFAPYWGHFFSIDCNVEVFDIQTNVEQLSKRLGDPSQRHLLWEDGVPVSQAACTHNTQNGAVVSWVYTPPHYRGKGYGSAVVAELSRNLLAQGHTFCCLFADAANPTSCGIYRKLGYYDLCVFDSIKFEGAES